MIHVFVYFLFLSLTCGYALAAGGQPERLASMALAIAVIASYLLPFDPSRSFRTVEVSELLIDLALLSAFAGIAAFANRFWPIWLAALHLVTIGIHGVKGYEPSLLPTIYAAAIGKLQYGLLIILAVGIYRHKVRLSRSGRDKDWSWRNS